MDPEGEDNGELSHSYSDPDNEKAEEPTIVRDVSGSGDAGVPVPADHTMTDHSSEEDLQRGELKESGQAEDVVTYSTVIHDVEEERHGGTESLDDHSALDDDLDEATPIPSDHEEPEPLPTPAKMETVELPRVNEGRDMLLGADASSLPRVLENFLKGTASSRHVSDLALNVVS